MTISLLACFLIFSGAATPALAQPTAKTYVLNGLVADVIAPSAITLGALFYMSVELRSLTNEPIGASGVTVDGRPLGRGDALPLGPGIADGIPDNFEWYGSSSISATPGDIVLFMTVVAAGGRGGVISLPMRLLDPDDNDLDTLPDIWERGFGLSTQVATGADGPDGDPDGDGVTNRDEFLRHSHPRGFFARYFAEGVGDDFFESTLRYEPLPGGSARIHVRTVDTEGWGASSLTGFNVDGHSGPSFGPFANPRPLGSSIAAIVESDAPFVAERSTKWPTYRSGSALGYGSHSSEGTASLSTRWLFAEGVKGPFHTYVALLNPSMQTAALTVTYFGADGVTPIVRQHTVAPDSRGTIDVSFDAGALASTDLGITIDSSVPIAAERSIYLDGGATTWRAGTSSVGAQAPSTQWLFAEGLANGFFDTYLLLLNPESTPAEVEIQGLRADGAPVTLMRTLAPRSRTTLHLNLAMPALVDGTCSFGLAVRSTNGTPIVAERTMWWNDPVFLTHWVEGHTSLGAAQPATRWFAPGNALHGAGGHSMVYLLVANPGAEDASVRVSLSTPYAGTATGIVTVPVPALRRVTLDLTTMFSSESGAADGRVSAVMVESVGATPAPIVAERSVYANTLTAIWELGNNTMLTPLPPSTSSISPGEPRSTDTSRPLAAVPDPD